MGSGNFDERRSTDPLIHELRQDMKILLQSDASKREILKSIEEQTKRTNGRVNDLEDSHEKLKSDHQKLKDEHNAIKNKALGIASTVSLIGVLIGVLIKFFHIGG